jgi:hypothetical protein
MTRHPAMQPCGWAKSCRPHRTVPRSKYSPQPPPAGQRVVPHRAVAQGGLHLAKSARRRGDERGDTHKLAQPPEDCADALVTAVSRNCAVCGPMTPLSCADGRLRGFVAREHPAMAITISRPGSGFERRPTSSATTVADQTLRWSPSSRHTDVAPPRFTGRGVTLGERGSTGRERGNSLPVGAGGSS